MSENLICTRRNYHFLLASVIFLIIFYAFDSLVGLRNFAFLFVCAIWLPVLFLKFNLLSKRERNLIFSICGITLIISVYYIIGYSSIGVVRLFEYYRWLLTIIICLLFVKFLSIKNLRFCYIAVTIIICFLCYRLWSNGQQYLGLATQDSAELGSALFSSVLMIFSLTALTMFLNIKRYFYKIFSIVIFTITVLANILILQRATNLVLTLIGVVLILIYNRSINGKVKWITIALFGLVYILYSQELYIPILSWLEGVVPYRMSYKMNDISMAIQLGDMAYGDGSFSQRNDLMATSLNSFLSSPKSFLIGIGDRELDVTREIGGHSFILDSLARYGMVGGILFSFIYKTQFDFISSYVDKNDASTLYSQISIIYVIYLFRNFYGNANNEMMDIVIMLYLPITAILIEHLNSK